MPSKANENSKWKQSNCLKRGKNAGDQDVFGFSFASDWLREWREFFFLPIKERSEAKKKPIPDFFRHSLENCSIVTKLSQKHFMIVVLSLSSLQLSASFSHVQYLTCSFYCSIGWKHVCCWDRTSGMFQVSVCSLAHLEHLTHGLQNDMDLDTYRLINKFPFSSLWEMPNGYHAGPWSRYCVLGNDTLLLPSTSLHPWG